MEFQEALNIMNYFMNETAEVGYVFGGKKAEVDKSIRFMLKDIDDLSRNATIDKNGSNFSIVMNILNTLKLLVLETVISKDLSNFLDAYLLLVMNWNSAIYKSESLETDAKLILRFKELHLTSAEVINQGKDLIKRFKNLSTFALPSIELSKHYLARFKEKVTEKGGEDKREIHALKINTPAAKPKTQQTEKSNPLVVDVLAERTKMSGVNIQEPGISEKNAAIANQTIAEKTKISGANIQEPGMSEKNAAVANQTIAENKEEPKKEDVKPILTSPSLSKLNFNKK
jgi:hypothetical protein